VRRQCGDSAEITQCGDSAEITQCGDGEGITQLKEDRQTDSDKMHAENVYQFTLIYFQLILSEYLPLKWL